MVRRTASAVVLALLLAACGGAPLSLREGVRSFTPSDYDGVYSRWTRSADEFDFGRLGEVLHVTATFESWEFRWAYVVRWAGDHSLPTADRTVMLDQSLADARQRHRFFLTLAVPVFREGDLTGRQSDIRVVLVDPDGHQAEPVELERISRPSADQRAYFPSIHRQRHTFRMAFPVLHEDGTPTIPNGATYVILRFAGSAGTVDLRWDLEPSAAPVL